MKSHQKFLAQLVVCLAESPLQQQQRHVEALDDLRDISTAAIQNSRQFNESIIKHILEATDSSSVSSIEAYQIPLFSEAADCTSDSQKVQILLQGIANGQVSIDSLMQRASPEAKSRLESALEGIVNKRSMSRNGLSIDQTQVITPSASGFMAGGLPTSITQTVVVHPPSSSSSSSPVVPAAATTTAAASSSSLSMEQMQQMQQQMAQQMAAQSTTDMAAFQQQQQSLLSAQMYPQAPTAVAADDSTEVTVNVDLSALLTGGVMVDPAAQQQQQQQQQGGVAAVYAHSGMFIEPPQAYYAPIAHGAVMRGRRRGRHFSRSGTSSSTSKSSCSGSYNSSSAGVTEPSFSSSNGSV